MSEDKQVVRSAAEVYEEFFVPAILQAWANRVAEAAGIQPGQSVLDVACGTGVLARTVAERVGPNGSVIGVDPNEGMLAVARRKAPAIEWRDGRAETLPFEANSFDTVVSQFGLMFFEDRRLAIQEMWRVLRPGGRLAVAVWDSIENTPGDFAVVNLLERLYGEGVAEGWRLAHSLGGAELLSVLFSTAGVAGTEIMRQEGIARFPSLRAWLLIEVKAWLLADRMDEVQFEEFLTEAEEVLRPFVTTDSTVVVPAPAYIVTATKGGNQMATLLVSPRLITLQQELEAGNAAALDAFWQEIGQQGTPLIEPMTGDDTHSLVTFFWRATNETQNVAVVSNLSGQMGASEAMTCLSATDLWYKTYKLPNDTRESYQFAVAGNHVTDPFNPRQHVFPSDAEIGFIGWVSSVFELPDAPPQPWNKPRPNTPSGQVTLHRIRSEFLNNEYRVWVYTPPGYTSEGAPYGFLLMLDGWFYVDLMRTPTILDNLLADGLLPPLVALMVGHPWDPTRQRDLACYPPFVEFVTQELLPWARARYHLVENPSQAGVVGASRGGLAAAHLGFKHPALFGHVLAQSGAFSWKPEGEGEFNWLPRQYAASPQLPLRFYLEAGLFETAIETDFGGDQDFLAASRRMRDVLRARGYEVHYHEFSGGHNPMNWSLADGLLVLLGKDPGNKHT